LDDLFIKTSLLPLLLTTTLLLIIPSGASALETIGIIKSISGDVYLANTKSNIRAVPNMKHNQGDSIRTGPGSNAGLIFEDDTVVSLGSSGQGATINAISTKDSF
jgi:hypothetical protein